MVTTVWIGTDDFSSLGDNEFGSSIALPAWVDFMKTALLDLPNETWKTPEGLSYVRIDQRDRPSQLLRQVKMHISNFF